MRLIRLFLDTFFVARLLHGVLKLVGVKCCTFGGESVNSI